MRSLVTSTVKKKDPFEPKEEEKNTGKVYRNEQTILGSTNQVSHTKTAYDRETINPDQEIQEMKRINHQVKKSLFFFFSL